MIAPSGSRASVRAAVGFRSGGATSDPAASDPPRVRYHSTFEELVPIRPREHGSRVPGQWVWFDALDLCMDAEHWQRMGWQQDGAQQRQAAISKLWECFNRMFPPETPADKKAWQREQEGAWQPRVTHSADGAYRATYLLKSISDGAPCEFKFCFERDLKNVLVSYIGPVRFNLHVVEAARQQKPPPEETWNYSHLVRP